MVKGIVVVSGEYEETLEFDTLREMGAFDRGLSYGAGLFAGSGVGVYCREDLKNPDELPEGVADLIARYLPGEHDDNSAPDA